MTPDLVGVPIKPFGVAKARLAPIVDTATRSRLGRAIAAHTLEVVASAGTLPVVVTADDRVASWARNGGWEVLAELPPGGLDAAASAVVTASPRSWAVLHADLPLLTTTDLAAAFATPSPALAPSRDGGTSLFSGVGPVRFRYGPGSFRRHRARAPEASVVVRPGLCFDLDTPADLATLVRLGTPDWLTGILGSPVVTG